MEVAGVWPEPFALLPLPPLPELTAQKTSSASNASRHSATARRRQ